MVIADSGVSVGAGTETNGAEATVGDGDRADEGIEACTFELVTLDGTGVAVGALEGVGENVGVADEVEQAAATNSIIATAIAVLHQTIPGSPPFDPTRSSRCCAGDPFKVLRRLYSSRFKKL